MKPGCAACRDGTPLPFEFKMAFQPIVDLHHQRIWGYEALVRGPNGESAQSVLNQVGYETRYRFDQAARVMAIEAASGLYAGRDFCLNINFMPNAVFEPRACIQKSLAAAERAGFPHERLVFEFTEDERISDPRHLTNIVETHRECGFRTAIDDFGTGYSGLSLLACLRPDLIKIDQDLVRASHLNHAKKVILEGLVGMVRALGIDVIAEGVENEQELSVLRSTGVFLFQGNHFAEPALMALPEVRRLT
ncbi:MAG: EAL domain-containing protein [Methyloceanibacter sp.]|nr:EAL domain-containing protein [Methyloceanibacter sp.]